MPPFVIRHIDHLVLRVRDIERSIGFYRQALGCEVARRRDDLGLVHLRAGTSMIDLVSIDGPLGRKGGAAAGEQGRNLDHLCLRIDVFDETALRSHLLPFGLDAGQRAASRFGAEGEGPSVYFSDPDGNVIELKGPAQPSR
jgi:glyoxylase I family protein